MKKKIVIVLLVSLALLALLFVPIPLKSYRDGGTREYVALTYRIVDWNRLTDDGIYEKTRVYFLGDLNKSIDELWQKEADYVEKAFQATVIELDNTSVIVEPLEYESERNSCDRISFEITELEDINIQEGTVVRVSYTGAIRESYPASVNAIKWEISTDLRHLKYTGEWLDKVTAEKYDYAFFDDIIITEIYSNCFFATTVIPMPYVIKLNGTLSEDWCVGDQVVATYENAYYDDKTHRAEVDFLTVEVSNFTPDPNVCYKPVIYLYPEKETDVSVKLDLDGELTCTYPLYEKGWNVTALPDGTLKDKNSQTYNYLYWEGETNVQYDLSSGFCVKGKDTAKFLEKALEELGLTRREANEFIVYWLPFMQNNPYNVISFQTDLYTEAAELDISPAPDTLIRVFMAWKASDSYIEIKEQTLSCPERKGFTVVEWGGTEIK